MSAIDGDAGDAAADWHAAVPVVSEPAPAEATAALDDGGVPVATTPAANPAADVHAFEFTGRASAYFRIWIVSLALSVVTLGVYSAWGKVRKKRYLYDHMRADGSGFEFRGSPLAILRGRAIALLLFGG